MLHHADSTAVTVERAGYPEMLEVFGWLDRDPVVNAYLDVSNQYDLEQCRTAVTSVRRFVESRVNSSSR
jgi:hypothetical protein